jgi:hypothetical protein
MVYLTEPCEFNAPQLSTGSPHIYAFVDVRTMLAAIQRFALLREYGFHFAIYESNEHVILPDGQVGFIKDKATKLESWPVHEFPFDNYTEEQ